MTSLPPIPVLLIPAFNEAATIGGVLEQALLQVPSIIVVDDGSSDDTAAIVARYPVQLIRHPENRGKGASLVTGFRAALSGAAEAVVTMDGDGQHRAEDIPLLLEAARRQPGAIVIGARLADRAAFPSARYRANRIANFWISWACGYAVADSQSGFRLYPRAVIAEIERLGRWPGFVFESAILIKAARRGIRSIPVTIPALYAGTLMRASHFRPWRDITRIVRMVAWELISRGMYPQGLIRSLRERSQG